MTKEQKRIKSEEFLKNQEKIIEIWKSGDKTLALILGRTIMNDRKLLQFCQINWKVFSTVFGVDKDNHILSLTVNNLNITYRGTTVILRQQGGYGSINRLWNKKTELTMFNYFLNLTCGPRPRKPKQI